MLLSVVIPTKNEARNIVRVIRSLSPGVKRGLVDVTVVDNRSEDETQPLARQEGARVFEQGPERCSQRNRGWREARGDWVMFMDADMELPADTLEELLARLSDNPPVDAYYVPEVRVGRGFRTTVRNFERSFYDATCVDGLRVMRRSWLERVGGYDEKLTACEDWDLDRRLLEAGARTATLDRPLLHHEEELSLGKLLKKKTYYAGTMDAYVSKWGRDDPIIRRQLGVGYRFFGVFVENGRWKKLVRHPILVCAMYGERFLVGLIYLLNR